MNPLKKLLAAITGCNSCNNGPKNPLEVGSSLPDVSQLNQDEESISLHHVGSSGHLLVFFYPKADTPGCTKQACSLRDAFSTLTEHGLKVLGVSTDNPKQQKAFQEKFSLPYDLLADHDQTVVHAFGVPTTLGHSKRQAFLFHDGALIWRDLSASTAEQAADILKQLERP